MSSTAKNVMFWMVAAMVIFLFWSVSSRIQRNERRLSFSDFFYQMLSDGVVRLTHDRSYELATPARDG